ncbi:Uncharacterised protein [Vibrio cholerae]|nr:Uncharacterised protein [Vibrio cholerae]
MSKGNQCWNVGDANVDVLHLVLKGSTRIAGRDVNSVNLWVLCHFPRQCVFATARADDENLHCEILT